VIVAAMFAAVKHLRLPPRRTPAQGRRWDEAKKGEAKKKGEGKKKSEGKKKMEDKK
jgi:hypothetical protein